MRVLCISSSKLRHHPWDVIMAARLTAPVIADQLLSKYEADQRWSRGRHAFSTYCLATILLLFPDSVLCELKSLPEAKRKKGKV